MARHRKIDLPNKVPYRKARTREKGLGDRKRKAMAPLERDIQKAILDYLHSVPIYCWTNKTQGTYDPHKKIFRRNTTKKGISDILGVLPDGRFLAIEVKSKSGRLSPEQAEFIDRVNDLGGLAFVARSLEEVQNAIELCLKDTPA